MRTSFQNLPESLRLPLATKCFVGLWRKPQLRHVDQRALGPGKQRLGRRGYGATSPHPAIGSHPQRPEPACQMGELGIYRGLSLTNGSLLRLL